MTNNTPTDALHFSMAPCSDMLSDGRPTILFEGERGAHKYHTMFGERSFLNYYFVHNLASTRDTFSPASVVDVEAPRAGGSPLPIFDEFGIYPDELWRDMERGATTTDTQGGNEAYRAAIADNTRVCRAVNGNKAIDYFADGRKFLSSVSRVVSTDPEETN